MSKGWTWTSRHIHKQNEVSLLAIVESLAASLIWIFAANKFGLSWAVIPIISAPFLLLRTEESTALGLKWGSRLASMILPVIKYDPFKPKEETNKPPAANHNIALKILLWLTVPLVVLVLFALFLTIYVATFFSGVLYPAFLARVLATTIAFFRYPFHSLAAIPSNWFRLATQTDMLSTVEMIPGVELAISEGSESKYLRRFAVTREIHAALDAVKEARPDDTPFIILCLYVAICALPAYLYRLSIKCSTVIYAPLIYIVNASIHNKSNDFLIGICDLALSKLQRWYAAFIIILFGFKIWLYNKAVTLRDAISVEYFDGIIEAFVVPNEIPYWQVASALNAAITFGIYFYADRLLKFGSEDIKLIRLLKLASGVLSLYTIACLIRILFLETNISLPPIRGWWPA